MIPWEKLGEAPVPGSDLALTLHRRDREFSLRVGGVELMNSRMHGSEEALAELALAGRAFSGRPHILIGGLGLGFTVRAALEHLPGSASVTVAELVPAVHSWNRLHLGHLAGHPLDDPRVTVREGDVADLIKRPPTRFDVVLLDVDNGPEGTTSDGNEWLYSSAGAAAVASALNPEGVLAVWSSFPSPAYVRRLQAAGFRVREHMVRARGKRAGRHFIWLASHPG